MEFTFATAWQKNDPKLEADALALWSALDALPANTTPEQRVKELAVLAYDGATLAGVSTLAIRHFDVLRQKFAFFREVVHPDYRRQSLGRFLTRETRRMIETWALENRDQNLAGMAAIYQAPGVGKRAISRQSRMALIGYTEFNEQVRASWFDHFEVPPNAPTLRANS
jgi:GNAT superfamily N-acetyltransferase